jgi:hypothetical protein
MSDTDPIKTWLIELEGYSADLDDWRQLFHDRTIASVEPSQGRNGNPAYFVRSQRLDNVLDTAAHAHAETLIAQMNGAVALCGGRPARIGWLWYVRSNDKPEPLREISMSWHVPIAWAAAIGGPQGTAQSSPSPDQRALRAMEFAGHSDQAAAALEHFGRPPNWYDMWIAYEIIEEALWDRTPTGARPKPDKARNLRAKRILLMSRNWVPEDDLRKFAESCNFHRHGERRPVTPERSATTGEAQGILARILQCWLEEGP